MHLFKMDGPFYRFLDRATNLIFLNLIFIICCLPVVTIGPALTALYYVTLKIHRGEDPSILKTFFHSFRTNFKQGFVLGISMLLIAALLIFDLFALTSVVDIPAAIAQILIFLSIFLLIALVLVALYVFAVLAQFDNTTLQLVKWSAILSIRHLPVTIFSLVLVAIPALTFLFLPDIFLRVMVPAIFLIVFSGTAMLQSFFYARVFDFYIPKEEEPEDLSEEEEPEEE